MKIFENVNNAELGLLEMLVNTVYTDLALLI